MPILALLPMLCICEKPECPLKYLKGYLRQAKVGAKVKEIKEQANKIKIKRQRIKENLHSHFTVKLRINYIVSRRILKCHTVDDYR